MGIGPRFAFAFALSLILLFGGYGVMAYRMEADDLVRAAELEVRTLTRSAQVAVENALRDDQPLDVRELVEQVEIVHPGMDLVVLEARGRWLAKAAPSTHAPDIERILHDAVEHGTAVWASPPNASLRELALAQPLLSDDDEVLGAIAVIRPLEDVQQDLERTRLVLLGTSVVAVIVFTLLALVLTQLTVLRPLARLANAMRRVRTGDMLVELPQERADEVGALTEDFNEMVRQLRAATQRAQAEAEKRRATQRSLERADKLAAIGQLAAGLAHEIGTPLHVVAGRADSLRELADDPEAVQRVSTILVEQTERITRVVEQLLHYARQPQTGAALLDVAQPIRAVLDLLELEAKRRGIALSLSVAPDTPRLMGSADQLQQVALNLVRNSLNATSPGGRIHVVVAGSEISAKGYASTEPAVRIEVCDDGRGIDPEDLARLFDPFFTTHGAGDGTGLGLAVVRSIVEQYHGAVHVDSTPGRGATFTVLLPTRGPRQERASAEEGGGG